MQRARKYIADPAINFPAADISFEQLSRRGALLKLRLYFSRVIDGPDHDLELVFSQPLAFQWEGEHLGLIGLPGDLPKCDAPFFARWTYPILAIDESPWADKYARRIFTAEEFKVKVVSHFAFISMNDLVHVLSVEQPKAQWVQSSDA
jgi:hypothetical protein